MDRRVCSIVHTHTHTHVWTESECPLRLSATRSRSIVRTEPQYCSPSWLPSAHTHTHTHTLLCPSFPLGSMTVRCVHGYRASTPVANGDHGTLGISVWLIDRLLQRHMHHIELACVCARALALQNIHFPVCLWVCESQRSHVGRLHLIYPSRFPFPCIIMLSEGRTEERKRGGEKKITEKQRIISVTWSSELRNQEVITNSARWG